MGFHVSLGECKGIILHVLLYVGELWSHMDVHRVYWGFKSSKVYFASLIRV